MITMMNNRAKVQMSAHVSGGMTYDYYDESPRQSTDTGTSYVIYDETPCQSTYAGTFKRMYDI